MQKKESPIGMVTVVIPTPETNTSVTVSCVRSLLGAGADIRLIPWQGSFARTVNFGLLGVQTPFVACVNNDTIAPPQWLQLLNHNSRKLGIVCPLEAGSPGFSPHGELVNGARGFFGGFWVMPTSVWEKVGGFNEAYKPYYCEDTDLLARLEERGYEILQDHRVHVFHRQNLTIKEDPERDEHMTRNVELFKRIHGFDPISYQH